MRSFNGEGSKEKLLKIYEIGLNRTKSEVEDDSKKVSFMRKNSLETTDSFKESP